jgi:hypothetical protein
MKLKKKVILGMIAGFFAVATVFNMNMLNDNGAGDVSLDAIAVMAQAQSESNLDRSINSLEEAVNEWWNSKIHDCRQVECTFKKTSTYVGMGTGVGASVNVSQGYTYQEGEWVSTTTASATAGIGISADYSLTITYHRGTKENCKTGSSVAHCWECADCS